MPGIKDKIWNANTSLAVSKQTTTLFEPVYANIYKSTVVKSVELDKPMHMYTLFIIYTIHNM